MKIKYKKEKQIHNPIGHVTATAIYMEKSGTERIRVREKNNFPQARHAHTHIHTKVEEKNHSNGTILYVRVRDILCICIGEYKQSNPYSM